MYDIESIIRIHSLKLPKANVIKEVEWLSLQNHSNLKYPTNRIVIDVTFINRFRDMLLRGKDFVCVDRHFPYLLYSDLAHLVGNKWMNLALITAFTTMINESQTYNRVITINTIYDMHDYDMMNMLKGWKEEGVISCSVVLNVRNKAGVTEILHKHGSGVHWSCVVISFHNGITIYCDSLAWPVPSNLHLVLVPFFHALCDVFSTINKAGIRNQEDVLLAHNHGASNVCEESCLSYLPFQGRNINVCGLACLLSCILLSEKDYLEMILNKSLYQLISHGFNRLINSMNSSENTLYTVSFQNKLIDQ